MGLSIETGGAGGAATGAAGGANAPAAPAPPAGPVAAGAAQRRQEELARLQRDDFPAFVRELAPTLDPADRDNPFAYSLGTDVPIEVKREVLAELRAGRNAPRTEVTGLSGSNATYTERDGPNGTIRVNADLTEPDPARPGQLGAFAAWGHMEEVGHWGDARVQALMGRPGADSPGDEGARYALLASGEVASRARGADRLADYTIPTDRGPRTFPVDTAVLKALGAEKLANGSFARENRTGTAASPVENFGPEGHYQTTYVTAAAAATALGMPPAEADRAANRMALGSQLPDMLANYDAFTQFKNQAWGQYVDSQRGTAAAFVPPIWTAADQQHLQDVYQGLHALPRDKDATAGWQKSERERTAAFVRDRIGAGDYVTAGVAIHRLGDLYAHIHPDTGLPYSGDLGHGLDGHAPDYLYSEKGGLAQPWGKMLAYQSVLSGAVADGLAARQRALGRAEPADAAPKAAAEAEKTWRTLYHGSLASSRSQSGWFTDGADAKDATETWFRATAGRFIDAFHARAAGPDRPLTIGETEVGGGYRAGAADTRSLDQVMDRFDGRP